MKRLLSLLMVGLFFATLTLPVSVSARGRGGALLAQKAKLEFLRKRKELRQKNAGFFGIRSLMAYVAAVDDKARVVIIRKDGGDQKILAENALIVKVTEDGARVVSLTDLAIGAKAQFWVGKERGSEGALKAFLITQMMFDKEKDEDAPPEPRIQFETWAASGAEGSSTISVPVLLSKASSQEVRVSYAVSGTASQGSDFSLASGELTIPAGQTSGHVDFTVMNDTVAEGPETIVLNLSQPVNALLGRRTQYTYTITDGD